jgi:hypothetical protein
MALYEIDGSRLARHEPVALADLGLYERSGVQRMVRDEIGVLGDDLLVIAEEFSNWEDARRRIDLLAVDPAGHLVVIELKRDDAAHMDLQALRYAAMVSSMDFEDVVSAYEAHLARTSLESGTDARAALTALLEGEGTEEPTISTEVRIVLVSADFGRELMTAVLWLNRFEGMDIRCIRLVPYRVDERVLLDIRQIVPLPEAADYQVRVRRKEQRQERARSYNPDRTRYHLIVDGLELPDENKRNMVRLLVSTLIERDVPPAAISKAMTPAQFGSVEGEPDDLISAFRDGDPSFKPASWFLDFPYRADGRTWLLNNKVWGTNTEAMLTTLCESFPEAGVTFRRAET